MKLITEYLSGLQEAKVIQNKETGEKSFYIEGVFMQADRQNRNGRIYSKEILKPAVDRYIQEQVTTGRAIGELNHPAGPNINLERVSHKIESLEWQGSDVIGKAKILNTPMGNIVSSLIEGGVQLGVSSRGMGSLNHSEGVDYVADDFMLNTVDIVQDPSAPDAYVNGILEGVEWKRVGNTFVPEKLGKKKFKKSSMNESVEAAKLSQLIDFLSKVAKY